MAGKSANRQVSPVNVSLLMPPEIALACETAGKMKAGKDVLTLILLGILAGAFIAFGANFMTIVTTGASELPWGVSRLLGGLVFSVGLIMIVVAGAELFTGDTLMVIAYASKRIGISKLLRAWALIYIGNIIGGAATAMLVFMSHQHGFHDGEVGKNALRIASLKASYDSGQLFYLSILCNVLVCLAVWMSFAARDVAGKVLVIIPPITAFVAAGFEHSIANIYFLSYGLLLKNWALIEIGSPTLVMLTPTNAAHNILLSTIGNLIGGSLMVGVVYWLVYLRMRDPKL